jgi:hypothetical protein
METKNLGNLPSRADPSWTFGQWFARISALSHDAGTGNSAAALESLFPIDD